MGFSPTVEGASGQSRAHQGRPPEISLQQRTGLIRTVPPGGKTVAAAVWLFGVQPVTSRVCYAGAQLSGSGTVGGGQSLSNDGLLWLICASLFT